MEMQYQHSPSVEMRVGGHALGTLLRVDRSLLRVDRSLLRVDRSLLRVDRSLFVC